MQRRLALGAIALAIALLPACVGGAVRPVVGPPASVDISYLWVEPQDLVERDLYHGPGGATLAPAAGATFTFVKSDTSGYSAGYDVTDQQGVAWSVKLGPEAQPEVAVSRILWAMGFHQPATYYVPSWTMTGGPPGPQDAARFRREPHAEQVVGEWSWYENEFVSTQPFAALVVANVMLNNWDWKTSNNKIYDIADESGTVRRRYVVRDLGASLGKTAYPRLLAWLPMRGLGQGSRNQLEDFESQGFIKSVAGDRVEFDYRGIHHSLIDTITVADVVWTARLMSRISDQQLRDAFRAAGYSDEHANRFATKVRSKIGEGLALGGGVGSL